LTETAGWLRLTGHADSAVKDAAKDKGKQEAARRAERTPAHAELNLPSVVVDTQITRNCATRTASSAAGPAAAPFAPSSTTGASASRSTPRSAGRQGQPRDLQEPARQAARVRRFGEAGLIHSTVEEFAQELATVVRRFLRLEKWKGTERIVVGGGLSSSQIGRLAMGRAAVLLNTEGTEIELVPIRCHAGRRHRRHQPARRRGQAFRRAR
jgi:hypothetical protein